MILNNNTVTYAMSNMDIANIMLDDAQDTMGKLEEAYKNAAMMYSEIPDPGNDFDRAKLDLLYDYMVTQPAIIMNDGDIIQLYADSINDPVEGVVKRISYVVNGEATSILEYGNTGKILLNEFNNELFRFKDISNTYDWTVEEFLSSIKDSLDTTNIYARLCNLVLTNSVDLVSITSILQDITTAPGAQVRNLVSSLIDLGPLLTPTSLLRVLQNTFKGMVSPGTSTSNNTIDWNDTDFFVHSYGASVIFGLVTSAAQVLGSILAFSGALIGKIAGAVILVGGAIINGVYKVVQSAVGEISKYDPIADSCEFAVPIWQSIVTVAHLPHSNELSTLLNKSKIVKICTPSINFYLWTYDGYTRCEAYATSAMKYGKPWEAYDSIDDVRPLIGHHMRAKVGTGSIYANAASIVYHNPSYFNEASKWGLNINSANHSTYWTTVTPITMSDDEMRHALLIACYTIAKAAYLKKDLTFETTAPGYYDIDSTHFGPNQAWTGQFAHPQYWLDGYGFWQLPGGGASDMPDLTLEDPENVTQARNMLGKFLYMLSPYIIYDEFDDEDHPMQITSSTIIQNPQYNESFTWSQLINIIIKSINMVGLEHALANAWDANFYSNPFADDASVPALLMATNVYGASQIEPSVFRSSYEIVPPKVEPGTTLKVAFQLLAITAAVVATVMITKFAVKKYFDKSMTSMYADVQDANSKYVKDPSKVNWKAYRKKFRKYNFLAKLSGHSTLSAISGWENGDGATLAPTASDSLETVDTLFDTIGVDTEQIGGALTDVVVPSIRQYNTDIPQIANATNTVLPEDIQSIKTILTGNN